jgi:hypothetical protein
MHNPIFSTIVQSNPTFLCFEKKSKLSNFLISILAKAAEEPSKEKEKKSQYK